MYRKRTDSRPGGVMEGLEGEASRLESLSPELDVVRDGGEETSTHKGKGHCPPSKT